MAERRATDADLAPIFSALRAYAEIYSKKDDQGRAPDSFVDGRDQNIEDADWLHYEGTSAWFPPGMLGEVMPWLVMHALVKNDDCTWIVTDNAVAVQHPLIGPPITRQSLNDGTWLEEYDYDEPPDDGEVALDSYSDLKSLLSRKRIYGFPPLH